MFGNSNFRAHCHATEVRGRVQKALMFVMGVDDAEGITVTKNEGFFGNKIHVLEGTIRKRKEVKAFLARLNDIGILEKVMEELDQRMDDDCFLHMRFGKQEAYREELVLVRGGDAVSVRVKVSAHPARTEKAKENMREFYRKLSKTDR
jgi:RNA binding exosome subunit